MYYTTLSNLSQNKKLPVIDAKAFYFADERELHQGVKRLEQGQEPVGVVGLAMVGVRLGEDELRDPRVLSIFGQGQVRELRHFGVARRATKHEVVIAIDYLAVIGHPALFFVFVDDKREG